MMKFSILSLTLLLLVGGLALGQPVSGISASQSVNSTTITAGNSVTCSAGGIHVQNFFYRYFDTTLTGAGQEWDGLGGVAVAGQFKIDSINLGIEVATAGAGAATPGFQPIIIRLYVDTPVPSFPGAQPLPINAVSTTNYLVADTAVGVVVNIPLTGPAYLFTIGDKIIVEIELVDGTAPGNSMWLGSNNLGETGPTYLVSAPCGVTVPTTVATIGFPLMALVSDLLYSAPGGPPVLPYGVNFAQPGGAGTPVNVSGDQLVIGNIYYQIYSTDVTTPLSSGPVYGLTFANLASLNFLIFQLNLPFLIGAPFSYVATAPQELVSVGLPPTLYLEAVLLDVTAGITASPVHAYTVQ